VVHWQNLDASKIRGHANEPTGQILPEDRLSQNASIRQRRPWYVRLMPELMMAIPPFNDILGKLLNPRRTSNEQN
jgi:hypothetical protein